MYTYCQIDKFVLKHRLIDMNITNINLKQIVIPLENDEIQEGLLLLPDSGAQNNKTLIVFIHGHNMWGGWELLAPAQRMLKQGFAVLLPSQIGFGMSTGKKDYCGPKTVSAIATLTQSVVNAYPNEINQDKVFVWGASRGATVASALVVDFPKMFAAGVFLSGTFDMEKNALWSDKDPEIVANIIEETGGTTEAYIQRSSIHRMSALQCPVLILHGGNDTVVSVEQAIGLDETLTKLDKSHELIIIKGGGHNIGNPGISREYIFPFLKKIL